MTRIFLPVSQIENFDERDAIGLKESHPRKCGEYSETPKIKNLRECFQKLKRC